MESEEYMNRKSKKQRLQRLVYSSPTTVSSSMMIEHIKDAVKTGYLPALVSDEEAARRAKVC
jgi:hypothetical protein